MTFNSWLDMAGGDVVGHGLRGQVEQIVQQNAAWALVAAVGAAAIAVVWQDGAFLIAIALLMINCEIIKGRQTSNSMVEYLNTAILHLLLYFFIITLSLRGVFRDEITLFFEAVVFALINIRYRFLSFKVIVRFLVLAGFASVAFQLWQNAYVPRLGLWRDNIPLEFYLYWIMPIEMLLVASPFLFVALVADLRAVKTGLAKPAMLDVYYLYSLPLLAFGLFPGIGNSLQANCELNSSYIAIAGIVALVCAGFILSLVTNRKSVLVASALASLPLWINRCVQLPFTEVSLIVCVLMLLTWQWLPKRPLRFV